MKATLLRSAAVGLSVAGSAVILLVPGASASKGSIERIPQRTFVDIVPAVATNLGSPAFNTQFGTMNVGNWSAQLFRYAPGPLNSKTVPGPFKFRPYLATRFTRQSDGDYIFDLRRGVRSAAGNTFTAADVVYSVQRWLALDFGNPLLFRLAGVSVDNPITVINRYRIRVNTTHRSAGTLQLFANIRNVIFDSTELKKHATASDPWSAGYLATHSASFGAYYVDAFQSGVAISLRANPNFFGRRPYFTRVIIRAVPDSSVRLQLITSGAASHTAGLDWTHFRSANSQERSRRIKADLVPAIRIDAVFMNQRLPQFRSPLVRRAVALALDRNAIIRTVYQGFGDPATSAWFNTVPIQAKGPQYSRNLTEARALMARAGYANGFSITLAGSAGQTGSWIPDELALIQSQLAQIGIRANVENMDPATFNAQRRAGRIDAAVASLGAGSSDPATVLGQTYSANGPQAVDAWNNPRFEALLITLGQTGAGPRYNRLMTSILRMLHDDPPVAPIMYLPTQHVYDASIKGFAAYAYPLAYYEYLTR